MNRLDKGLFTTGLADLQTSIEMRVYVNTLSFAQDLGDIISKGILAPPELEEPINREAEEEEADNNSTNNSIVISTFSDIRERRKLGKRILKAVQPMLEMSLQVEAEIYTKPAEALQSELEALIDASIDGRQPNAADRSRHAG